MEQTSRIYLHSVNSTSTLKHQIDHSFIPLHQTGASPRIGVVLPFFLSLLDSFTLPFVFLVFLVTCSLYYACHGYSSYDVKYYSQ